jgi:nucleotide-binding universal stress UspA family protein
MKKMSDDDNNNDDDEIPLRKILVPIDGSDWSFRAAKYAIKIAKMANAEIVCVHAVVSLPATAYANVHAGVLIPRYIEESKKEAQKWYDEVHIIAEKAGVVRVSAETILDVFSVADAIISYAERNNVDLIIMGTKGRTGLKKFVLGSVASGVISHANCPVLVVR